MSRNVGIDIGSRTVKMVVTENGTMTASYIRENAFDPLRICKELLAGIAYDRLVATGYGRHLIEQHFPCEVISEIKAFAIGAKALFPTCRTILDIGGQDTKAILLAEDGKLDKFEMNDKCAAGTGRFLEIMAMALGYSLCEFPQAALGASRAEKINQMCTVFAESEVVSLISRGASRPETALGIHQAVATRSVTMLKRLGIRERVLFAGGVAINPCMQKLIAQSLGTPILIPQQPQLCGALGCALS